MRISFYFSKIHLCIYTSLVVLFYCWNMRQFFLDAKTQFHKGFCYFLQSSQRYLNLHNLG